MTRGEQRLARGLTAGGRKRALSPEPRPPEWPALQPIEGWVSRSREHICRSIGGGGTWFKVRLSGSSWVATESIIDERHGLGLPWPRHVGTFATERAAKLACERIARGGRP